MGLLDLPSGVNMIVSLQALQEVNMESFWDLG